MSKTDKQIACVQITMVFLIICIHLAPDDVLITLEDKRVSVVNAAVEVAQKLKDSLWD